MDAGAVYGAAEQLLERDEAVPAIQVQAAKDFIRPVAELRDEELARGVGRDEGRADAHHFAIVPPSELQRSLKGAIASWPDARLAQAP
jgi:hypothetical protein